VKLSKKDPVVLTLDGHYFHSRNIAVIHCAEENGVHSVCLPPHSAFKLNPLELSFMQPLKTYSVEEIEIWLKKSSRVVTHYQITELVAKTLLEIDHGSYCCKRVRENRLVFLQPSHI
jgi:hypothetical protein